MKKRIFTSFSILVLLSVLLLSASVSVIVYNATRNRELEGIKDRAILIADLMNNSLNPAAISDFASYDYESARITLIAHDGTVLLDNKAVAASMENHSDRDEFKQAIQTGIGESTRYSPTLSAETYYYAIRLDDGNVLRISKTVDRLVGVFVNVLLAITGVTVIVLILANILANRLVKRILEPLNNIDFENDKLKIYDEFLPFIKKIDRQKAEISDQLDMLKNRADTIEIITGNMNEGLILIDKNAVLLSINKSAAEIFHEKDMTGKNIIYLDRDLDFQEGVKKCLSGVNTEMVIERDGRIYSVYFSPVSDNEILGGVILFQDISDKYEAEKQRKEFSANISHELKTPLTTIFATAEMIVGGMVQEQDISAFAEKITIQAKRLIDIIEDIIKLSEFDEGTKADEHSEFDLYELAQSVIEVLRHKADEKQVSIELQGERLQISANKLMIDELLFNLIDNAIKYNKDNGRVTVALSGDGTFLSRPQCQGRDKNVPSPNVKIAVSDTGIGIAEEHQSRVFERFYRADKSRSKKTGGTGLGLSIVKHITEHHGGNVVLTSKIGDGTTVECVIKQ